MTITYRSDITVQPMRTSAMDYDVVQAARVSTLGAEAAGSSGSTAGLINYLMRDRHGSPFEHNSMTFLVQAPMFVAREWMRHRVGWSYNEESARYRELKPVFYIPAEDRNLQQVGKPGAYRFEPGTPLQYNVMRDVARESYRHAWNAYQVMLRAGIAREVARSALPVGTYTSFFATCNARSLMHFLSLRTTAEAARFPSFPQREIEMAAEQMEEHFARHMPLTHAAYVKNGRVAP
ncbi:ThyX-like thymidylate synthase [Streptomyces phage BroPlease]|uniref:ThyX n=1 Tax=Streptomyces phage phiHau3 TaxID=1204524 RepID=K4IB39_9CAUD|nr:ThyX [Streptomyces phage phiHau3]AFU62034.1 ThyX [Streptomyces phage phiHau3]USH44639.1 ThyX-like thymidylate synthase [Streptomyces phage BroPlease]